jgi:acyl-CoA synthetase (AMP-forming)/AMP-acid ligase II
MLSASQFWAGKAQTMSFIECFERGASFYPGNDCFISGDVSYTYAEIRVLVNRVANKVESIGIGEGRQGAVLSGNDPIAFSCLLGLIKAGAAWVPLNPKNSPEDNFYLCETFEAELVFYHSDLATVVDAMRSKLPRVSAFICIDKPHGDDPDLETWLGDIPPEPKRRHLDPEGLVAILGTGGTTGRSKGVMLTRRNVEIYVASHLSLCPSEEPPIYLAAAPLTHAAGFMVFPMMARGGTTVILPGAEPLALMQKMEEHGVTDLFLPPTVIYMMLSHPKAGVFDFSSLRYFYYGAAPMSVEKLKEAISLFGPVMTQFFGQSEAPISCCFLGPKEHLTNDGFASDEILSSCGRPTPFVQIAIMDDDGNLVETGERGELVMRSNLVMKGYYKNPEATAEVSQFDWHHTGDIAFCDEMGFYHLVDRKKDMIITGGFNVFSSEVERAILAHPAVQDCAVIGVPDEKWGEAVKAIVQLRAGRTVTEEEIRNLAKEMIGSVKAPKSVEIWQDLPRSPVGKVLKRSIREKFWNDRERDI